jgi:hypothetical protein
MNMKFLAIAAVALLTLGFSTSAKDSVVYEGKSGAGQGKHIVFLSGDEEYRSEGRIAHACKNPRHASRLQMHRVVSHQSCEWCN